MHRWNMCLWILAVAGFVGAYKQCMMPDRTTGKCRLLRKCPPIHKLHEKRKKTFYDLLYIYQSSSSCNTYSASSIMVCCPPERKWGKLKTFNPIVYDDIQNDERREQNEMSTERQPSVTESECGQYNSNQNRILGGSFADIDQFPWLVLLEYENKQTLCGGSLISTRYILTAAHCIKRHVEPKFARLAEYNTTSDVTNFVNGDEKVEAVEVDKVPIVKNIAHPNYTLSQYHHDIGLCKLSRDAVMSDFVRPICLPRQDLVTSFQAPTGLTVAGWGSDGYRFSDVKRYVKVPFVPLDRCRFLYRYRYRNRQWRILDSQICAGGKRNEDSCYGDSGGPLMYETRDTFVVVGIVSYGPRVCGTKNVPGVYTYVYSYLNWMRENML